MSITTDYGSIMLQSKINVFLRIGLLLAICISTLCNAQSGTITQISANYPICVGAYTSFKYEGPCTQFQWQFEGSTTVDPTRSGGNVVVVKWNTATPLAAVAVRGCGSGSGVVPGPMFAVSANVNPAVSISGPSAVCGGANVSFTSSPVNGGASPSYTWMINGVAQPGQSGSTFNTNQLGLNNTVSVNMRSNHGCVAIENVYATSAPITILQVTTPASVSVSISGKVALCGSEIPTYTANVVNGGSSPVIRWFKNGSEVSDNEFYQSPQYQYKPHYGLPNGGVITCEVSSSLSCVSGNPAVSNPISVTNVIENPILNMTLDRMSTFCQGDPIKFKATSNFPITSYAWSIDNSVTLSYASEFSPTQLFTGNVVYLTATVSTSCGSVSKYATSQAYPITVHPALNYTITPGGSKKVCFDCSQEINATSNENYSYQWRKDGNSIGWATNSQYVASEAGVYDVWVSRSLCDAKISNKLTITKNVKPLANAGPDQIITLPTRSAALPGSGSDADGTIVGYHWTLVSGTSASLSNEHTPTLKVDNLQPGNYVFRLTVTDDTNDTGFDDVHLTIPENVKPLANAGPDQIIALPTRNAVLPGSGSDPDGTIVGYHWTLISGTAPTLKDENTPTLKVDNLQPGSYVFRLTVTDDTNDTGADDVQVLVNYPTNNYNWIKETTVLDKGKLSNADVDALNQNERTIVWQYFDGIGRPMQTVSQQMSPTNKDIVQPIIYDQYGREVVKYLPFVSSQINGNYKTSDVQQQGNFYQNAIDIDHDIPYSKVSFEPSPLNRVMKQGAVGAVWQPDANTYSMADKTIKKRYEFNSENEVFLFTPNGQELIVAPDQKYYQENQLSANKTYDESNHLVIEFIDKEGKTVCKKIQSNKSGDPLKFASTYYIYDDFGNLVMVLPPEAVENLKTSLGLN